MSELQLKHRACPFVVKSVGTETENDDAPVPFSGLASVFFNVDAAREIVDDGAFNDTLSHFLGKGFITVEHRWDKPIGKPLKAGPSGEGLAIEGEVYPKMYDGESVAEGMRRGVYQEMSIGYYVDDAEQLSYESCLKYWSAKGYAPSILDHQRAANGVTLLKKIRLEEAAICIRGMNSSARVTGVKSALKRLFGSLFGAEEKAAEAAQEPAGIHEKELDDIVESFMPAIRAAIKASLTEQATKAACEVIPKVPEDPAPPQDTESDEDDVEAAMAELELIELDDEAI